MPRVDSDLVQEHRKDPRHEEFLQRLNDVLAEKQFDLVAAPEVPALPIVFIIGPPRSGTTLLSQLLAARGGYGYVSNFTARFYKAPAVGMMLQEVYRRYLVGAAAQPLESSYGQTFGLLQPHEFGYFWDRWFDRGQKSHKLTPGQLMEVPVEDMSREIASMEAVCGMPMIFKHAPYCSLQVPWLIKVFPGAVFVSCSRAPLYNCQSIAMARETLLGSREKWLSTRPAEIEELVELPWYRQIAGQVRSIRAEIEKARPVVPAAQWIECRYEELCASPGSIIASVDAAVVEGGAELPDAAELPEVLSRRDHQHLSTADFEMLRAECAGVDPWRAR